MMARVHISLWLAGLFVSIPFVSPYHALPLTTFYQEWFAFMLGLILGAWALFMPTDRTVPVPWIAIAMVGVGYLIAMQIPVLGLPYPARSMIGVLYVLWAAFMAWVGVALREQISLERIADWMASAIAAAAFLAAISGFMQYLDLDTVFGRVIMGEGAMDGMYGVIGQRNMFADYMACGLLSALYLAARRRISFVTFFLVSATLVEAMACSASRSAWAYAAILLCAGFWVGRVDRRITWWVVALVTAFVMARISPEAVTVGRAVESSIVTSPRALLAAHAWLMFAQHPLLGVGFGEFAWNMFNNATQVGIVAPGIDRNAHNIVLQVLSELGIVGLITLLIGIAAWAMGAWGRLTLPRLWIFGLLAVQGFHSLVEFPMWFAPNLGLAMLLMGMVSVGGFGLWGRQKLQDGLAAALVVLGIGTACSAFVGYDDYQGWYNGAVAAGRNGTLNARNEILRMLTIENAELYSPYFDLVMAEAINMHTTSNLQSKLDLNTRALHVFPMPSTAVRQALLLERQGRAQESQEARARLARVYPDYQP